MTRTRPPPISVRMCRAALFTAFLLVFAPVTTSAQELPRVTPEEAGFVPQGLATVASVLEDYVAAGSIPGAVVAVLRDGAVVFEEAIGYSDVERGKALKADAIFRIASQTKAIVSVAVMTLQDEGALLISDPVGKHLPAFRETTVAVPDGNGGYDIVAANRPVTIRDLLTHTAGISYGYGPGGDRWSDADITGWYFAHLDEPVRATVDRMAALPFQSQPGERFVYGYSTTFWGRWPRKSRESALDDFLRSRIFEPLDMRDTHFYLPAGKVDRLATVYGHDDEGYLVRAPGGPGDGHAGAVRDRAAQELLGRRRPALHRPGLRALPADDAERRLPGRRADPVSRQRGPDDRQPHRRSPRAGLRLGLGFQVRLDLGAAGEPGSEGDYGWGGAYHTTYWVDPVEHLVVVYFTQLRDNLPVDDHAKLRALVYGALR